MLTTASKGEWPAPQLSLTLFNITANSWNREWSRLPHIAISVQATFASQQATIQLTPGACVKEVAAFTNLATCPMQRKRLSCFSIMQLHNLYKGVAEMSAGFRQHKQARHSPTGTVDVGDRSLKHAFILHKKKPPCIPGNPSKRLRIKRGNGQQRSLD